MVYKMREDVLLWVHRGLDSTKRGKRGMPIWALNDKRYSNLIRIIYN